MFDPSVLTFFQDKNAQARAYSAVGLKYCQRAENPSHCHVTKGRYHKRFLGLVDEIAN